MDFSLGRRIIDNMATVVVGKQSALELMLVALLADGHVLLEDVPGVGKTLATKCLAKSVGGTFKRIQFTPDLLPADVTGFNIYDQKNAEFKFQPGPVMCHILLADEINRAIPRTQSSLLESMAEHQVTVDGRTYPLPVPFLVLATQNPIELEGTFPLPEAQLDRFLLKISLGYPSVDEEMTILERFQQDDPFDRLGAVAEPHQIIQLQQQRRTVTVSTGVREYITRIVDATRHAQDLRFGSSPRGSLGLMRAAQGRAALKERAYVLPDDVKQLVQPVLGHRVLLSEEARISGTDPADILAQIVSRIPVPQ